MKENELLKDIAFNIIQGRAVQEDEGVDEGLEGRPAVTELVNQALEQGIEAKTIVMNALTQAMEIVGKKFEAREYLIPDMLASAECVGAAMDILKPHLLKQGISSKGKFVIATVSGDLHDIGKNIVSIMLKGEGYDVIDLGCDVSADKIADTVKKENAKYLGLSALLTTTMQNMHGVIERIRSAGFRDQVKILIGGAPTSKAFAEQIGADAHCKDAFQAVERLRSGL